jgi:endonuclease/exonuclease/phosphatase family metal-dependent hydrolase
MDTQISLLSWNVHMHDFAENNEYVVSEIKNLDLPDIICLQEYVEGRDSTALRWLKDNDYKVIYLASAKFPQDNNISQGVLTAVRKSLVSSSEKIILRKDSPRRFRNFNNIRGAIDTVVTLKDSSRVSILNFHATLPRPYTVDMRRREFLKLVEYMGNLPSDRKIILCGDFNFIGIDNRKKLLIEKFDYYTGSFLRTTWKHKNTFGLIRLNLDYIFWTPSLNIKAKVKPFNTSDHRPISVIVN